MGTEEEGEKAITFFETRKKSLKYYKNKSREHPTLELNVIFISLNIPHKSLPWIGKV